MGQGKEDRLTELEKRLDGYERLLNALGSALYEFDFYSGKFVAIGEKFEELTGYPRDHVGGWSSWECLHSVTMVNNCAGMTSEQAGPLNRSGKLEEWNSLIQINHPDGSPRWLRDTSVLMRDDEGEITGTIGLFRDSTKRVKAERNLAASETRFRAMIDRCPLGFLVHKLDEDGLLVFDSYNPAAQEILPFDLAPLLGLPVADAFPYIKDPTVFERYIQIAREGGTASWDQVTYEADSVDFAYQVYAFQVMAGATAVLFHDISAQERSRQAILESEQRFRDLVNSMEEALFMANSEGVLTFASPSFARQTGVEASRAIGLPLVDFVAPEYRMLVQRTLKGALDSRSMTTEFKLLNADGERRWMRLACHSVAVDGHGLGISGLIQDIHEKRLAEAALLANEERLKALLESSSNVVGVVDAFGQITYVNRTIESLLGYDAGTFEGTSFFVYCHPRQLDDVRSLLAQASRAQGWTGERVLKLQAASGAYLTVECRFRSMVNHPGLQGIVVTMSSLEKAAMGLAS